MRTSLKSAAALLAFVLFSGELRECRLPSARAETLPDCQPALQPASDRRSPELLAELLNERDALETQLGTLASDVEKLAIADRLRTLEPRIDEVSGQLHGSRSRLFWYTNLDEAQAVARQTGRPILKLRLLGKQREVVCCANRRFFRTTLYANQDVARLLRENFVLHWESVRPAPMLTIDFGDGRKVMGTVTGNSIHYVLTPDGEVVDALPGLFGPAMFMRLLDQAQAAARNVASLPPEARPTAIAEYHQRCAAEIAESWDRDLRRINDEAEPPAGEVDGDQGQLSDDHLWQRLAILHAEDATLDAHSRVLIASQNPTATQAGLRAVTKSRAESPLVRLFRELQSSIAQDSVRNQYLLHRQVHDWFASGGAPVELRALNEKVYAELFLTPSSDPWLGLIPADTYTGLQNNGLVSSEIP